MIRGIYDGRDRSRTLIQKKLLQIEHGFRYSVVQMNATSRKKKSPAKRIRGIVAASRELGCTRDHLRLVIQGKRVSRSLSARYAEWQAKQQPPIS